MGEISPIGTALQIYGVKDALFRRSKEANRGCCVPFILREFAPGAGPLMILNDRDGRTLPDWWRHFERDDIRFAPGDEAEAERWRELARPDGSSERGEPWVRASDEFLALVEARTESRDGGDSEALGVKGLGARRGRRSPDPGRVLAPAAGCAVASGGGLAPGRPGSTHEFHDRAPGVSSGLPGR